MPLVQVREPVKIVYGVAGFGLVGGLFGGNALDAGGRKVHLAAIGVPHAADTLVMRPGHGRGGLAGGFSGAAQVQDLPQVQAFQLGTVSGALQRIQAAAAVQQPAAHMVAIGSAPGVVTGSIAILHFVCCYYYSTAVAGLQTTRPACCGRGDTYCKIRQTHQPSQNSPHREKISGGGRLFYHSIKRRFGPFSAGSKLLRPPRCQWPAPQSTAARGPRPGRRRFRRGAHARRSRRSSTAHPTVPRR